MIEQADLTARVVAKDFWTSSWLRVLSLWQNVINRVQNYGSIETYSPSATGFSHQILDNTGTLIMTPAAGYATGTLILAAKPFNGLEQKIFSSQAVTTLTISAGGLTVVGSPGTIAANGFMAFTFNQANTTWYRTG